MMSCQIIGKNQAVKMMLALTEQMPKEKYEKSIESTKENVIVAFVNYVFTGKRQKNTIVATEKE